MLCDGCLQELGIGLSKEARAVLFALRNGCLNKLGIMMVTKYNVAVASRAISELEACRLIVYHEDGRSKVFQITDSGKRLLELKQKGRSMAIS